MKCARILAAFLVIGSSYAVIATQSVLAAERLVQLTVPGCVTPEVQADIDRVLKGLDGILQARADYKRHHALVAFDDDKITLDEIKAALDKKHYAVNYYEFLD